MDRDHTEAPPGWIEELARSDGEIGRGERVPAEIVHGRLRRAIARLEVEISTDAENGAVKPSGH